MHCAFVPCAYIDCARVPCAYINCAYVPCAYIDCACVYCASVSPQMLSHPQILPQSVTVLPYSKCNSVLVSAPPRVQQSAQKYGTKTVWCQPASFVVRPCFCT